MSDKSQNNSSGYTSVKNLYKTSIKNLYKCELKTSIKNIERYIGTKMRVVGVLETIDASSQKYRLINVQKIVIFLE
ncbi:MAG: hypothetical protein K9W44_16430 [Candidatus Lokiarchaeota archaeon]|nr:hypothetical protein [Candidatus Harpocratesius repetitus]